MQFVGTLQLHEGMRMWPLLLGNIGELLVNRKRFESLLCTGEDGLAVLNLVEKIRAALAS